MSSPQQQDDLKKGFFFIGLAALQFGLQPFLVRWYASKAITSINVLSSEIVKIFVCSMILYFQGEIVSVYSTWTFWNSVKTAGVPATLYAVINMLYQMVALVMLTISAVMLTMGQYIDQGETQKNSFFFGIVPVLSGSVLSGVATAVSQKVLQNDKKNSYLYTSELAVWGIVTLFGVSIFWEFDQIAAEGVFKGWSGFTIVPVFVNAIGGILVGLVVKYAGGVRKGFGTVAGMFLTAALSFVIDDSPFTLTTWIALPLLIASVYIHTTYPYKESPIVRVENGEENGVMISVKAEK